jgi:hypothetical protein
VAAAPYPVGREADVVLRNGSTAHVRPIRPSDAPHVLALFRSLSPESRWLRFFSPATDLEQEAERGSQVDYVRSFGLLATAGPEQRVADWLLANDRGPLPRLALANHCHSVTCPLRRCGPSARGASSRSARASHSSC